MAEGGGTTADVIGVLRQIGYFLERDMQPSYRVQAYRKAADLLAGLSVAEVRARRRAGTLTELPGIGPKTSAVIDEVLTTGRSGYLDKLSGEAGRLVEGGESVRTALRGDMHLHSNWSDGGSPIIEMARTAARLGHSWIVLTDHSARLKVANGLTRERRLQQFDVVAEINDELAGEGVDLTVLNGIEADILDDGRLDCGDDILERLDFVVASVHSKLKMDAEQMTARMVAAVANPHVDVLGHCTGRLLTGGRGKRGESQFDAEVVFAACAQFGTAVEINSRPERLDPPMRLLELAAGTGCEFTVDTDAHAPGQLDWQVYGCERAERAGLASDRIVNTRDLAGLRRWRQDRLARA